MVALLRWLARPGLGLSPWRGEARRPDAPALASAHAIQSGGKVSRWVEMRGAGDGGQSKSGHPACKGCSLPSHEAMHVPSRRPLAPGTCGGSPQSAPGGPVIEQPQVEGIRHFASSQKAIDRDTSCGLQGQAGLSAMGGGYIT